MTHFPYTRPGLIVLIACAIVCVSLRAQKPVYPVTKSVDQVDTYFGVKVPDPYRWLEDDRSPETGQWVEAQNRVTQAYLGKIPYRQKIRERLERYYNYPKYGAPFRKGNLYFFYKNNGLQNQAVLYVQHGLDGTPEVLLDPNALSPDGTTRLMSFTPSKDVRHAAVGLSRAGSDWEEVLVMDLATRHMLPDTIRWTKFSGAAWRGDGFYYTRFPVPEAGKELSSRNVGSTIWFHRVNTAQLEDALVYEDRKRPERMFGMGTTDDERYAFLWISESSAGKRGNALWYRNDARGDTTFIPVVADITDDSFGVIDNVEDRFLLQTNRNAPNGRVMEFDPRHPQENEWHVILPEKPEPLRSVSSAGGKLFATYMKDVASAVEVYSLTGAFENAVPLPAPGVCWGLGGERDDRQVFYVFQSFTFPPTIYQYDIAAKRSTVFRAPEILGLHAGDFVTEQVFVRSKDGTRFPMFIVHKPGLKKDGSCPTLLYGYGGFNISITPSFGPLLRLLLEQGFIYASANIRGGGEYGERWHEAGTKLRKQNVFDDFIAAAEYLIAERYTSPAHLAIQGASNGGLLVGAVMNQRPELFRTVIAQVGVMDMLRFHKFTIGAEWISDFGSSDDAAQFQAILKYSPLQNIRPGAAYPAVLITTADHDDRVVPAHSFKYAATLQANAGGENPILVRIDTRSGHGSSNTAKTLETVADIDAFLFFTLGVTPDL